MIHLYLCFQALLMIWSFKSIRIINRLRLWRKTINLYCCFIAFTDSDKQVKQLKSALLAAVLSAIYDYETDWQATDNPYHSLFRKLLSQHVQDEHLKESAFGLFSTDRNAGLSPDGLERGSLALHFYHGLIGSKWLGAYSSDQISDHGRKLQMIDDLLDLNADARDGCTNCFLTDKKQDYTEQAQRFLSSAFFSELARRSFVYSLIGFRCQKVCNDLAGVRPSLMGFTASCRPLTMLYALAMTLLGFQSVTFEWIPALLSACTFAAVTGSIMAFNDLVDRNHDTKKGKLFASQHTWLLARFWIVTASFISALLIGLAALNGWLALYIGTVWLIGLAYSAPTMRRWYILQPLIVAGCAAAPLLIGCVHGSSFSVPVFLAACAFASIIVIREIVKDIEDQHFDAGYKETIPVRFGHIPAVVTLIGLCFLPALLLAVHPFWAVQLTGYGLAGVQFSNGLLLLNHKRVGLTKASIDGLMAIMIAAILLLT